LSHRTAWRQALLGPLRRASPRLGSFLLAHAPLRFLLNEAYERGGASFQHAVDVFFSASRVPCAFVWRCRFGRRELRMPVLPEVQRSWNAALVWRWSGNRSIRRLYELYVESRPAGTFVDVGANDGTHTYPFALHGYRCIAFEPQQSCIDYMRHVCRLNGFSSVEAVTALVTDEPVTEAELWVSESTWFSSRLRGYTERFEAARSVMVRSVSFDAYCRKHGVRPSFVKIDVEGWEWRVLRSAADTIRECLPDLLIEVAADNPDKRAVWELLAGLGYRCMLIAHFTDAPFRRVSSLEDFMEAGRGAFGSDYFFTHQPDLVARLGA
jgi:FkbM family methyltransferase